VIDVRDGRSLESLPDDPSTSTPPPPPTVTTSAADDPPRSVVPDSVVPDSVLVAPGDNLWDLSAGALARATGRERAALTDEEIAAYWRVVCDTNRDLVRSGDVNLVYPGEVVTLPPLT
jgi:hypothetical protein